MTVRWKPLLILSGLFLVIAVVSVIAFAFKMIPRSSAEILTVGRAARAARQYENAEVHFKRALQKEAKNAAIHEEFAALYTEWSQHAPAAQVDDLKRKAAQEYELAADYGKNLKEPRRILLREAIAADDLAASAKWAKRVIELEPKDAEAHYVLGLEALELRSPPDVPEAKPHLEAVEKAGAAPVRIDWLRARIADLAGDHATRDETLAHARSVTLPADAGAVERMALLRLRLLDVVQGAPADTRAVTVGGGTVRTNLATVDPAVLAERIKALQIEVRAVIAMPPVPPARIIRLGGMVDRVQRSLTGLASQPPMGAGGKAPLTALVDSLDGDVDALYKKSLDDANRPELSLFLTYAEHLRFREKYEQCLAVVDRALRSATPNRSMNTDTVMALHAIAVESALSNVADEERFTKASPHIKGLLESHKDEFNGLGHLFQGAIDLEQSGVGTGPGKAKVVARSSEDQYRLRASALQHLERAATKLPKIAEAQARYGVALVLTGDQAYGRQFLQNALRQGTLAPQYQIWAAWSMVQAGYPEEAEPIVDQLMSEVTAGRSPRELEGTLDLLYAEIHQARRSPADLKKALSYYKQAVKAGEKASPAVQLRLAQIEVQLGHRDGALQRIAKLREVGQGLPAVEHLAVLILLDQGKKEEALKTLAAARAKFPDNDELVGVEAALLAKDNRPQEAERVLASYLNSHPNEVGMALMRAQILADQLKDVKQARLVLIAAAEQSVNSAPLVQLAVLDLRNGNRAAVAATIEKIRGRWKESATADLLEAQLALDKGNYSAAKTHFDNAIAKDPGNKLVKFIKAQMDVRNGDTPDAQGVLEGIVREGSTKEVDSGVTLMDAAQTALIQIELQSRDYDSVIQRLEGARAKDADGTLARSQRWQLAAALAAKGQWEKANVEVTALLDDAKAPPTNAELLRGANFYRFHGREELAANYLDKILAKDPNDSGAVVLRAYLYARAKKPTEGLALLRRAIDAAPKNEKPPAALFLMLAAIEYHVPPANDRTKRAMDAIELGLKAIPTSAELIQQGYRVLAFDGRAKDAVAFVESKTGDDSSSGLRKLLVEVYSDQKDYAAAERIVRGMLADNPDDSTLAANLIQLVAFQALRAADRGERDLARKLNESTAELVRGFRKQFPRDVIFLQAECDLASRQGDYPTAIECTRRMDELSKTSPNGPLNRARLYEIQSRLVEAAEAYEEALQRNERLVDVRLLLGRVRLRMGETAEAIRQAGLALAANADRVDAMLLHAQALVQSRESRDRVAANGAEAVRILNAAIKKNPKYAPAYHMLADLQRAAGQPSDAVATLEACLKQVPDDSVSLSQVVTLLTSPRGDGSRPTAAELDRAAAIAEAAAKRDQRGQLVLAVAIGYHKAGQLALALPWAEKAVAKSDVPITHLSFGDLYLSLAEGATEPSKAKQYFRQAVDQYDLVLKTQANSIEAINNKAWILHTHLGETDKALELAQGLLARSNAAVLPPEFFDTLGAIQQAKGQARDAEASYNTGLKVAPNHPVLNYRMAKLLAADRSRAEKANPFLERALAGRQRLSPSMASELDALAARAPQAN
jgi:tetratricopeptide (TPR) repeat protein